MDYRTPMGNLMILITVGWLLGGVAASAQGPPDSTLPYQALIYTDGDPELEDIFQMMKASLGNQAFLMTITTEVRQFSDLLSAGDFEVYVALSANSSLLTSWKSLVPDGDQYLSFTIDQLTGNVNFEYFLFSPYPSTPLIVSEELTIAGGVIVSSGVSSTVATSVDPFAKGEGLLGGIIDIFGAGLEILGEIIETAACILGWTVTCLGDFIDSLKEIFEEGDLQVSADPTGQTTTLSVSGDRDKSISMSMVTVCPFSDGGPTIAVA